MHMFFKKHVKNDDAYHPSKMNLRKFFLCQNKNFLKHGFQKLRGQSIIKENPFVF